MILASDASYAFSSWSGGAYILAGLLIASLIAAWKGKGKFRFTAIGAIAVIVAIGYALNAVHH